MKIRDSYRIVFMGDGCVGKSSLISQFIDGYFSSGYKPTIEDLFSHSVKLKSKSMVIKLDMIIIIILHFFLPHQMALTIMFKF